MKLTAVLLVFLLLTGCSSFKSVRDNRRTFVLTSQGSVHVPTSMKGLGIGRVEMPDYLRSKAIAIRQGAEIRYSDKYYWAESLDPGMQRTLAANLGFTNVFLSFWRREQVEIELYVTLDRFELDEGGTATLKAFWRLFTPGSSKIIDSGVFETQQKGPRLSENPALATMSLSETIGKMTEEIRHRIDLVQSRQRD